MQTSTLLTTNVKHGKKTSRKHVFDEKSFIT